MQAKLGPETERREGARPQDQWAVPMGLILHEVAKIAGLEGHGSRRKVGTLYMGNVESTCAYWVPLMDWKGEAVYLEARGVDYIAQLPGNEDPVR
jgi:hypothetical protein